MIRAAGAITQSNEIIVIGSQSILGSFYAGREKDMDFVATAIRSGIVDANLIRERINKVSGQDAIRDTVQARLERLL